MKRLLLLLPFFICALASNAQNEPLFIFDQFYNAKIHFKNRSVTSAAMNYDAANDKMYFKQNGDLMELTNMASIDSIVWAKKRSFISYENHYVEKVAMENGIAYIQWKIKNVNIGSKGAYGSVTQGKVETISVRSMGVFSAGDAKSHSDDVYQKKNTNEYYLLIDGELKKASTKKQILKLYPQHKADIEEFMDKQDIKMTEPLSVLELLNYCMGL